MYRAILAFSLLFSAACSQNLEEAAPLVDGTWTINGSLSNLSYVSIKADELAETNAFNRLSGSITSSGLVTLEIDLSSVSTGVDIRDERMREIFFVVTNNPNAILSAQIDPATFETLGLGDSLTTPLEGSLSLNGREASVQAEITVTRTGVDRVLAVATKPVIVEARRFGLIEGLAKLQALAGLSSITPVVPVTFSIVLER